MQIFFKVIVSYGNMCEFALTLGSVIAKSNAGN